jgi:hypothetical protein
MNQIETGTTPTPTDTSYLYNAPSNTSVVPDDYTNSASIPGTASGGRFSTLAGTPLSSGGGSGYSFDQANRNTDYSVQPVGIDVTPPAPPSDNLNVNNTPATPDQSNTGLTYDPRTNEVVNSSGADNTASTSATAPITTSPNGPGSGAATTGAQTTPQGSAATGSAAGSC